MVGESARQTNRPVHGPWLRSFVAVLCISLVVLGGVLSVAHSHNGSGESHPDCGLCVVAHTAIQSGTPAPQAVVVQVFIRVEVSPQTRDVPSISIDPLFSRPPPADLNRA